MPKSSQRCVTNLSSSSKVPSSRSRVTRSRAVSLPALCSRSRRSSPLPASASALRRRRSLKRSLRIGSSAMVCCLRDFRTGSNWFATNFWGDLPGSYLQAKVENQPVQRRECERQGASRDRCIRAEVSSRKECPWRPPGYEATDWRLRQPRSCPAPGQSWWLASARRHRSPRSHRRKSSLSRGGSGFLSRRCRCFHKLNDKAFHDSAHLIELKTAAALLVFRILWFLKVTMQNHSRCSDDQRRDSDDDPPIDSQLVQRLGLRAEAGSNTSPNVSRAFSQSFRNPSSPRSVSGCLKSCSNTFEGMVPMCAPMRAAATTCNGCRRLAASTCVE